MPRLKLGYVYHKKTACGTGVCAAHRPSKGNPFAKWKFFVRLDKYGIMERQCPHGVGHTDPDSIEWAHRVYDARIGAENVSALGIHGCDGCCFEAYGAITRSEQE